MEMGKLKRLPGFPVRCSKDGRPFCCDPYAAVPTCSVARALSEAGSFAEVKLLWS